jgi:sulfate transport system substrate-binding protein
MEKPMTLRIARTAAVIALGLALLTAALVGTHTASAARTGAKLTLVAYSAPGAAYAKLIPAFQATAAGKDVSFSQSYAASEQQSKAVDQGLGADVVNFSIEPDMNRLVRDGLVASSWKSNKYKGIVARSVVAFIVRKGNPKHIKTFDDLIKSGVQVVVPNPITSGGARWDILAAYGAERRYGKTDKQAQAYLKTLFKEHVVSQDSSARAALNTFLAGKGDVLLTYESDARLAQANKQPVFYIIPKATLRIDTPIAVLAKSSNKAAAQQFVNYLWTEPAQEIWAQNGYRPVDPVAAKKFASQYPTRPWLFTIDSPLLGGWPHANARFFDPTNGIVTKIEQNLG